MAINAITYGTAASTYAKNYKKVSTVLSRGINEKCKEASWVKDLPLEDVEISAREILLKLDLNEAYGAAFIGEAELEAQMATPALEEATLGYSLLNARFLASFTARALDQKHKDGQVERQLRHQALKQMNAIANRIGIAFYGFSDGRIAEVANVVTAPTATLTLRDAYGDDNVDSAAFLSTLVQQGDYVALHRAGTVVTDAFGEITSKPSDGVIVVAFQGSVTTAAGDTIVFANQAYSGTAALATHSEYNKAPVGMKEVVEGTGLHSLTHRNWVAAVNNSTAGPFSVTKLRNLKNQIRNKTGDEMAKIAIEDGVANNMVETQSAYLMLQDAMGMTFDGGVKIPGVEILSSKRIPPGHVIGWTKGALAKLMVTDWPEESGEGEVDKLENRSAYAYSKSIIYGLVCRKRLGVGAYRNQTTS